MISQSDTVEQEKHCRYCNNYRLVSEFITLIKWVNGVKVRHDKCMKCAAAARNGNANL